MYRDNTAKHINTSQLTLIFEKYIYPLNRYSYGQEFPSGESTITFSGVNFQLLAVVYRCSSMGKLQSTTTS